VINGLIFAAIFDLKACKNAEKPFITVLFNISSGSHYNDKH